MPNKSIHQLTFSPTRQDDDRLYVVRSGVDYQIPMSALAPALLSQTTVIPAADVLTLNSDPVQVVDTAPAGFAIFPVRGVVQFSGGSVDYATNTVIVVGVHLLGDIGDRSQPIGLSSTNSASTFFIGNALFATVQSGNPTAGNSDLTITTFYYLVPIA